MAALPKPPGQRRRRNLDQGQWVTLPADGRGQPAPPMPPMPPMPAYARELAADWWQKVWASPMAAMFLPADILGLGRAAELYARSLQGEATSTELAELRQLEDRYGLSPKARRSLQWQVAPPDENAEPEPDGEDVDELEAARLARRRRVAGGG